MSQCETKAEKQTDGEQYAFNHDSFYSKGINEA